MKKLLLLSALFLTTFAYSQDKTALEKLKTENAALKNKLKECGCLPSGKIKSSNTNNDLEVRFISATGNTKSQVVTVTFMFRHHLTNQMLKIHDGSGAPTAYDFDGNTYTFKAIHFTNSRNDIGTIDVELPTGINVKGEITFKGILPSVKNFSLVRFDYYLSDIGGYSSDAQKYGVKNVPIVWK